MSSKSEDLAPLVLRMTKEIDQLKEDLRSMEDYALALKRSESELMDEVATLSRLVRAV